MRRVMCVLGVLALLAGGAAVFGQAAPAPDVSVQAIGLRVVAESPDKDLTMGALGAMGKGTSLVLLVQSKGKQIVKLDELGSSLRVLQDDKGTDLRGAPSKAAGLSTAAFGPQSSVFQMPAFGFMQTSKDGKAGLIEVNGGSLPAKGSAGIKAEGTLKLSLGSEKTTQRQQSVPLKEGTKITVGPVPLTIVKVEQAAGAAGAKAEPKVAFTITPEAGQALGGVATGAGAGAAGGAKTETKVISITEGTVAQALGGTGGGGAGAAPFDMSQMMKGFGVGEAAMTITVRANDDISGIASITFYDKAGKKVESNVIGSSSMSGMGKTVVDQQISLSQKLDAADVAVEFWKDLEVKDVPFTVTAGLSLQ
jgi:hypothetical protein